MTRRPLGERDDTWQGLESDSYPRSRAGSEVPSFGASKLCFSSLAGQLQNWLPKAVQPCVRKGHVLPVSVLGSDCRPAVQIRGPEGRGEEPAEPLMASNELYRRETMNS